MEDWVVCECERALVIAENDWWAAQMNSEAAEKPSEPDGLLCGLAHRHIFCFCEIQCNG